MGFEPMFPADKASVLPLDERSKTAAHKVNYSLVGHCLETDTPGNYSIVSKKLERLFWTGFEPATV